MTDILAKILEVKRFEVSVTKAAVPLSHLEADVKAQPPPRGLAAALRRPPGGEVRVLAEIKRKSPSVGPIRPGADPAAIAREYEAGGAAALSVLTDRQFFDGELAFLGRVKAASLLPVLRKDFLIDPYQVVEARARGADAVLLIVAALAPAQLADLAAAAAQYGMDALVEVHSAREAEVALAANATLLGVNHRDLKTFEIDMSLTGTIAQQVPPDVTLVAESGIKAPADVQLLGAVGAHAVLVGEQLMRAPSPGAALRALRGFA